tara:strand:+ start:1082 stop:1381 length:300 start_codon:yes stop_codon:yes gene_type:complete
MMRWGRYKFNTKEMATLTERVNALAKAFIKYKNESIQLSDSLFSLNTSILSTIESYNLNISESKLLDSIKIQEYLNRLLKAELKKYLLLMLNTRESSVV